MEYGMHVWLCVGGSEGAMRDMGEQTLSQLLSGESQLLVAVIFCPVLRV